MRLRRAAADWRTFAVRSSITFRRFRLGRAVARAAWAFVGGFDNRANWHIDSNGEAALLHRLSGFGPTVILDVGANIGEWSRRAAEQLPQSQIHAFEPVPATATQLTAAVARFGSRVQVHVVALGARRATQSISTDVARSSLISLLDAAGPDDPSSVSVEVITGDSFCAERDIAHVDFLKIDAEGTDHLVIHGFETMLSQGRVDVVQFEYGVWALETKFLLKDFYQQLTSLGYTVGKLFPRGVAFADYSTRWEDFRGLNFVAVNNQRSDLISALRER